MGFPLRSNIFKVGTNEQAYFSRFPIQVAVLFSPKDEDFSQAFKEIFFELDKLTAEYVAFFAVLDPPKDWVEVAQSRDWWRNYQNRLGQLGFSMDDRVLVNEMARLFGVSWHTLPVIVISTDLWTGEYVISGTSPYHIKRQLETLTDLARNWGKPNLDHITNSLNEIIGFDVEYHPPDSELRFRLNRTYSILDTAPNLDRFNRSGYERLLEGELRSIEVALRRVQRSRNYPERRLETENYAAEKIFEDVAGRLVVPATVAEKVFRNLRRDIQSDTLYMLDEESLVMAETSLTIGNFLENIANNNLGNLAPLRLRQREPERFGGGESPYSSMDFAPGAQGAWKALELEINLSVIQAARTSRSIKMPEFFGLYDSELKERCKTTGKPLNRIETPAGAKDINQKDRHTNRTGRHRFLTLGDAWHATKALADSPSEIFNSVIASCLGQPLPSRLFDAWEQVFQLRNKASHTQALRMNEYAIVVRSALSPDVLHPLMKIKKQLSGRR